MTATAWNDPTKGYGWETGRGSNGLRGVRHYLVNTPDEGAALFATGLPAQGDPWGTGSMAGLIAREFTCRYLGGKADTLAGVCVVSVVYSSESQYSGPEPAPLKKWLAIEPAVTQVQVMFDADYDPATPNFLGEPILNGDGAARDVGLLDYVVHKFVPLNQITDAFLRNMDILHTTQAVNLQAVTFPPLLGGSVVYVRQPGECRFKGFTMPDRPVRDDLYELVWRIGIAQDHFLHWEKTDEYGKPGGQLATKLYKWRAFGSIW